MMLHHTILVVIGSLAVYGGYAMPKLYVTAFFCEITQPFFSLREFKGKNEWTGPWSLLNNICFFVSFTFARFLFFPMILVAHWKCGYLFDLASQSGFKQFAYYFNASFFVGIVILNSMWYRIILRGVIKLLKGETPEIEKG